MDQHRSYGSDLNQALAAIGPARDAANQSSAVHVEAVPKYQAQRNQDALQSGQQPVSSGTQELSSALPNDH